MPGPLEGIRVFDLTLAGVGPRAAKFLALLGADVIHIDPPGRDLMRVPPSVNGVSVQYLTAHYNKRNIVLDLRRARDKELAWKLIEWADVFLENMRPGVVARLGLSYEVVSKVNPRIVYCSASGYGQTGPMVGEAGADPQIQAFSGLVSLNGAPGGRWEFYRYPVFDINTSNYIAQGILLGLVARLNTGKGQKVEVAMTASALALQTTRVAEYFATGQQPPLMGSATVTTVPHQAFQCLDKQYLAVGVVREDHWRPFCEAIGLPELASDPRFDTNPKRVQGRKELVPILERQFLSKPVRWWEIRLSQAKVPHGRFLDFSQLRYHPQIAENGYMPLVDMPHTGPLYLDGIPWKFPQTPLQLRPNPRPGENTEAVSKEFGVPLEEKAAAGGRN